MVKIIAITGGSGSGKSTLSSLICDYKKVKVLKQDNYYKTLTGDDVNYDHPDSIDWDRLKQDLIKIKRGVITDIPVYDFVNRERSVDEIEFEPTDIIILEGTLILSKLKIRKFLDLSIYIDTPSHIRYKRRLFRDMNDRGRTEENVKEQFNKQVEPMHIEHVESSKKNADIIVKDDNTTDKLNNKLMELIELLT